MYNTEHRGLEVAYSRARRDSTGPCGYVFDERYTIGAVKARPPELRTGLPKPRHCLGSAGCGISGNLLKPSHLSECLCPVAILLELPETLFPTHPLAFFPSCLPFISSPSLPDGNVGAQANSCPRSEKRAPSTHPLRSNVRGCGIHKNMARVFATTNHPAYL